LFYVKPFGLIFVEPDKTKILIMKNVRIYSGLLIMLLACTSAFSQTEKEKLPPEKRHEQKLEHLKKELGLSPEQAQKIDIIDAEYKPKVKEANMQVQTAHQQKEELLNEIEGKIKEVLTDEQKVKFEELKKKQKIKRKAEHQSEEKSE
jgi:hypothetical protein